MNPRLRPMQKLGATLTLVPRLGIKRCGLNFAHRLKKSFHFYSAINPAKTWADFDSQNLKDAQSPIYSPKAQEFSHFTGSVVADAERVLAGQIRYFSKNWSPKPADWRSHPQTNKSTPLIHWSLYPSSLLEGADVKWVWEPSRFDWVYILGRAYKASKQDRFVAGFLSILTDWREFNPPFLGVNWECGQECGLRLMALAWAASTFADSQLLTAEKRTLIWSTVAALAERVEVAIGYAISQNNNHGLSESLALYLAGSCLPHHPSSKKWIRLGRRLFLRQVIEQFAPDGTYILNSMNYSREALRLASIGLMLEKEGETALFAESKKRLRASVEFLFQLCDKNTGRLPNYGANDGANIMALSECEYLDYRPLLQTLNYQLNGTLLFEPGPYDEELIWRFGENALKAAKSKAKQENLFAARDGGYFAIRDQNSKIVMRCHTHVARPSHADMLHADIWIGSHNIAGDGGTYSYDPSSEIGTYLKSTGAHNTVVIGGQNQMREISRFLWADWTRAKLLAFTPLLGGKRPVSYVSGEHQGYERLGVKHRRTLFGFNESGASIFAVVDDIFVSQGSDLKPESCELFWHLQDPGDWQFQDTGAFSQGANLRVSIFGPLEVEMLKGDAHLPRTARSLYYGNVQSCSVLRAYRLADSSFRMVTVFAPHTPKIESGCLTFSNFKIPLSVSEPTFV